MGQTLDRKETVVKPLQRLVDEAELRNDVNEPQRLGPHLEVPKVAQYVVFLYKRIESKRKF